MTIQHAERLAEQQVGLHRGHRWHQVEESRDVGRRAVAQQPEQEADGAHRESCRAALPDIQ